MFYPNLVEFIFRWLSIIFAIFSNNSYNLLSKLIFKFKIATTFTMQTYFQRVVSHQSHRNAAEEDRESIKE